MAKPFSGSNNSIWWNFETQGKLLLVWGGRGESCFCFLRSCFPYWYGSINKIKIRSANSLFLRDSSWEPCWFWQQLIEDGCVTSGSCDRSQTVWQFGTFCDKKQFSDLTDATSPFSLITTCLLRRYCCCKCVIFISELDYFWYQVTAAGTETASLHYRGTWCLLGV